MDASLTCVETCVGWPNRVASHSFPVKMGHWGSGNRKTQSFPKYVPYVLIRNHSNPGTKYEKKIANRLESVHFHHYFCNSRYPSLRKSFFGLISHQNISILHFIEQTIPYFESTTNTSEKHLRIHQIDDAILTLLTAFPRGGSSSVNI